MLEEKVFLGVCRAARKLSDNAVIENFFGLLKSELLYLQEFRSMGELIEYLDYTTTAESRQS